MQICGVSHGMSVYVKVCRIQNFAHFRLWDVRERRGLASLKFDPKKDLTCALLSQLVHWDLRILLIIESCDSHVFSSVHAWPEFLVLLSICDGCGIFVLLLSKPWTALCFCVWCCKLSWVPWSCAPTICMSLVLMWYPHLKIQKLQPTAIYPDIQIYPGNSRNKMEWDGIHVISIYSVNQYYIFTQPL